MNSQISEANLLPVIAHYFYKQGGIIHREIPIGFCRADLLIFTPNQSVIAVELKLADWKKALIQAQNYQLGADYVYIAFPETKKDLLLQKAAPILKKKGIGLLLINIEAAQVQEYIKAQPSKKNFGSITMEELKRNKQKKHHKPLYL